MTPDRRLNLRCGAAGDAADGGGQFRGLDRLGDVNLKSGHHRAGSIFGARVGRQGDRWSLAPFGFWQGTNFADELIAVLAGHADVADDHVGLVSFQEVDGLIAAIGRDNVGMGQAQNMLDEVSRVRLIVDDEDLKAR